MESKKKKQKNGRTGLWVIVLPPILVVLLYAVFKILPLFFPCWFVRTESTFLDTILAIVSIAISVWIGLNIYNILDSRRLEKVESDIVTIKDATQLLKESSLEKIVETSVKGMNQSFLRLLSSSASDDRISHAFYGVFSSPAFERISSENISLLNEIELHFAQMYDAYKLDRETLKCYHADLGRKQIEKMKSGIKTQGSYFNSDELWIQVYLLEREAEFYYYHGTDDDYIKACELYMQAVDLLSKHKYERERFSSEYCMAMAYLLNSCGWSKNKRFYLTEDKQQKRSHLQSALCDFEAMEQYEKHLTVKYWRNWGVCHESMARIMTDDNDKIKHLNEAIVKYESAYKCAIETEDYKIFATMCSAYFKLCDVKFRPQKVEQSIWWDLNYQLEPDTVTEIDRRVRILEHAMKKKPEFADFYVQRIKAMCYMLYFDRTSIEKYTRCIEEDEQILEIISRGNDGKNLGRYYPLRDFFALAYQITGDKKSLSRAIAYNNKLTGKDDDSKIFKEIASIWENECK